MLSTGGGPRLAMVLVCALLTLTTALVGAGCADDGASERHGNGGEAREGVTERTEETGEESEKGIGGDSMGKTTGGTAESSGESTKPIGGARLRRDIVAANTEFGFKLFGQLVRAEPDENVFVSPSSVAFALAMTLNGASGETKVAMLEALELAGVPLDQINETNRALMQALESVDPEIKLSIANSLWAKQGYPFREEFVERNADYYHAELTELDFDDPGAPAIINEWVDDATNGKIPKIVDTISPSAVLYLINAIHFKGIWTSQFDEDRTEMMPFRLPNGSEKMHPLMRQRDKFRYLDGDGFQAISLPYGDESMSMYVFLPGEQSTLAQFLGGLDAGSWEQWMTELHTMEGTIFLPRFEIEYEADLKGVLSAMGMRVAFSLNQANFDAMSPMDLFIESVKHKTFVEVNEEGTEAAAVTGVGMAVTAVMETFTMQVDRPFFCAIRDERTGTVLFMGAIVEPM